MAQPIEQREKSGTTLEYTSPSPVSSALRILVLSVFGFLALCGFVLVGRLFYELMT